MARRMAAAQAMLNSMTPEQRAQLQQLSRPAARGHGPALAGRPARSATSATPSPMPAGTTPTSSRAPTRSTWRRPCRRWASWATSTSSSSCCGVRRNPGAWPRSTSTGCASCSGDEPAASLERMAEITKMLTEAGLIEQKEGRLELTPAGLRRLGQNALAELFGKLDRTGSGATSASALGIGHERAYQTKPYEYGDPFNLDINRTIRNAVMRGEGSPVQLTPRRLRDRTDRAAVRVIDRADARPVAVDADARQLPAGQEGRDGAALAHLDAVPARLPGHGRVLRGRHASSPPSSCPR